MNFDEFLKDQKYLDKAVKCKDIDEFKKLVDESDVVYFREDEIKKAWSYVKSNVPDEDGSLGDDALDAVSGGCDYFPISEWIKKLMEKAPEDSKNRNSNN